ncbi:hypothetical protein [Nocardia alni]|uniref:hypothetical protein n=1 Tax=Nocardia alni TaxID=2815723 RepID=UPI001C2470E2|nr:hypothetical protein [Nocardia alni]
MASSDSSDPLEVDIDALSTAGSNFANLSNTLSSITSNLSATIDALGEPWGDDKIGEQFASGASGYLASKDSLLGATGSLPSFSSIFTAYGSDIVDAAEAFNKGEDEYGDEFIEAVGATGSSS